MDPVLLLRSPVDDDQGSRIRREGPRLLRPCLCCRICRSSGGRPCPYAVPHMLSGFAALATIVPVPAHRWAAVGAQAACSAAGHAPCCVTSASLLGGHREGARPLRPPSPPTCPSSTPTALFRGRCRGLKDHRTRLSVSETGLCDSILSSALVSQNPGAENQFPLTSYLATQTYTSHGKD